jgi:hypothetical protein
MNKSEMRSFLLERTEDVSGVSGTGVVAEGVEWTDGQVTMHWFGTHSSLVIYKNIKEVQMIHGHEGRTAIRWLNE